MGAYYLDIETTGFDTGRDKIITIQYAMLERRTGRPGRITVLKEWELGEGEMLRRLIADTPVTSSYEFDFIPVGYNLKFEHGFLLAKSRKYNLPEINVLSKPCVDLHHVGIMMNAGEFAGSGLDKLTGKPESGRLVPRWYSAREYGRIEDYVLTEAREFVRWYGWLLRRLPDLRDEWRLHLQG